MKHAVGFARLYHSETDEDADDLGRRRRLARLRAAADDFVHGFWLGQEAARPRTYVSTLSRWTTCTRRRSAWTRALRDYFKPTMVTDKQGELHEDILNSGLLKNATAPEIAVAQAV